MVGAVRASKDLTPGRGRGPERAASGGTGARGMSAGADPVLGRVGRAEPGRPAPGRPAPGEPVAGCVKCYACYAEALYL